MRNRVEQKREMIATSGGGNVGGVVN